MNKYVFPRLTTLDALTAAVEPKAWNLLPDIAVVCCQHLLETTGSLLECLFSRGLRPGRTFIIGKIYSTNEEVAQALRNLGCNVISGSPAKLPGSHREAIGADASVMWRNAEQVIRKENVRGIVVLDDGAHVLGAAPMSISDYQQTGRIVGVEQTTSGLNVDTLFPVINVASSAVKRHFEPPMVCKAVLNRVRSLMELRSRSTVCGVIGLGKIGTTLIEELRSRRYRVCGFDLNARRFETVKPRERCDTALELFEKADIIFGCSGRDSIPTHEGLGSASGTKTLVSCSSGDIEFRSLLCQDWGWTNEPVNQKPCPTLTARSSGEVEMCVLRSGYPVNFDNSRESVPLRDIQLTRGLLLGAVLQAIETIGQKRRHDGAMVMLDPDIQAVVLRAWRSGRATDSAKDRKWFERESRGTLTVCNVLAGAS